MQKSIKRYICIAAILSTMIGYAQKAEELEVVIVTIRSSNKSEAEKQAEIASIQAILNGMYQRARDEAQADAIAKAKAQAEADAIAKAKAKAESGGSGTPLKEVVVPNNTKIWYLDNDGDGYFGVTKQSSTSPGALWRTSKGAGSDCNDYDATKTTNCTANALAPEPPMKGWFLDKDGDGYHGVAQGATASPGSGWTNNTKGSDCDDTNASKTTDCGTQTPTTPPAPKPDPCAEIKKALADAKYKAMIAKLDNTKTLHLPNETGYWRDKDGNFTQMKIDGSRTCLLPDDRSTLQSIDHVHQEPWTVVQDDGSVAYEANYIMPSRQDLWDVYYMVVNAKYYNIPLNNIYVGTTNSLGNYQIRYTGNPDSLSYDSINKDNMGNDSFSCDYVEAMKDYGNDEKGLLHFINTVMGKTDLGLYKIETTGGVKLTPGQNNTVTKTPCP